MMEHRVSLPSLPSGIEFPADLQDRISFDPQRRELVFRGLMYKREYDRLFRLSRDLVYHEALEKLFASATERQSENPSRFDWLGYLRALVRYR
jgi:hypothetical protein